MLRILCTLNVLAPSLPLILPVNLAPLITIKIANIRPIILTIACPNQSTTCSKYSPAVKFTVAKPALSCFCLQLSVGPRDQNISKLSFSGISVSKSSPVDSFRENSIVVILFCSVPF
jgi:hypothetical protein